MGTAGWVAPEQPDWMRRLRRRSALDGSLLVFVAVDDAAAGALVLTRSLEGLLFGVSQFDAVTFLAMAAVLGAVTLLASWIPAQRASAVDPIKALKYE